MDDETQAGPDEDFPAIPVRVWLLPLLALATRSGRNQSLTWWLAGMNVLVFVGLTFIFVSHRASPERVGLAGWETIPRVGVVTRDEAGAVLVESVMPGSGAEAAGIESGDEILAVEDIRIQTRDELRQTVLEYRPGSVLGVRFRRDHVERSVGVTTTPVDRVSASAHRRAYWMSWTYLGIAALLLVGMAISAWRLGGIQRLIPWWAVLAVVFTAAFGSKSYVLVVSLSACVSLILLRWTPPEPDPLSGWQLVKVVGGASLAVTPLLFRAGCLALVVSHLAGVPAGYTLLNALQLPVDFPLIAAVAVAPIAEEVVFRGLLLPMVRRARGPWFALLMSSAAFGLLHVFPMMHVESAAAMGLLLGYVRLRTGRLLPCIALHGLFNLALVLVLGIA